MRSGPAARRQRSRLHRRDHRGPDRLPRVEGRQLGRPLLASRRTSRPSARPSWAGRRAQAGVREAERKVIGLSVDRSTSHGAGRRTSPSHRARSSNFPLIADPDRKVADLYDMIHPNATTRSPCVRCSSSVPTRRCKLTLTYPATTGRNFDEILRVIDSLQLTGEAQGRDAGELEAGRGRHHRPARSPTRTPRRSSPRAGRRKALPAHRPSAREGAREGGASMNRRRFLALGAATGGTFALGGLARLGTQSASAQIGSVPTVDRLVLTNVVDNIYDVFARAGRLDTITVQRTPLAARPCSRSTGSRTTSSRIAAPSSARSCWTSASPTSTSSTTTSRSRWIPTRRTP